LPLRFGSLKKVRGSVDTHKQEQQQSGPRQRSLPPYVDPLRTLLVSGDAVAPTFEKIALPSLQAVARYLELRGDAVGIFSTEDAADGGALLLDVEVLSRPAVGWHTLHYITVHGTKLLIAKL
jgi:hypothetical protein